MIRTALAASLLVVAASASAQQVQAPPVPKIVPLAPAQAAPPAKVQAARSQRPADTGAIRSTGPSTPQAAGPVAPRPPVSPLAEPPRTVIDAQGRVVPNAQQLSPMQARDPATGRLITTPLQPASTP